MTLQELNDIPYGWYLADVLSQTPEPEELYLDRFADWWIAEGAAAYVKLKAENRAAGSMVETVDARQRVLNAIKDLILNKWKEFHGQS